MQQTISKIVKLKDIIKALQTYRNYLKTNGIDYKEMEEEKITQIKEDRLSKEEEERNLRNVKDIYLKTEKAIVKQMLMTFFTNELRESQIKLEEVFTWVDSNIEKLEKEFSLGFNKEDKLEIGFEVLKTLFAVLSDYTTLTFNEKEVELMKKEQERRKKEAKENIKANRAFHRETPISDSMGDKE